MKHFNILKKALGYALVLVVLGVLPASAQLSGTYTIGGTSPDYATLSAAVSALSSSGVSGPVTFQIRDGNYSGSSWQANIGTITGATAANRITFDAANGSSGNVNISIAGTSSANYVLRFNGASFVTVKNLSLTNTSTSYGRVVEFTGNSANDSISNCTLTGPGGNSSSTNRAVVYANNISSTVANNVFYKNEITKGSYGVYWYGSFSYNVNNAFVGNTITSNYYGSIYTYRSSGIVIKDNDISASGVGQHYGIYCYYPYYAFDISGNTVNISGTSTQYGVYTYFGTLGGGGRIVDNNITTSSGSGYNYPLYNYYCYYDTVENNTVNATSTSGRIYTYASYYSYAKVKDNTFNSTSTSGYIYMYHLYGYNQTGVCEFYDNNINLKTGSSGYIYSYNTYFSYAGKYHDNTINLEAQNGRIYNYVNYYATGGEYKNNKITSHTSGSGYNYPMYNIGGFNDAGLVEGNVVKATSTSGVVYGMYSYYMYGGTLRNNVVHTKSGGTTYGYYSNYSQGGSVENNTFHCASTGFSYGAYIFNTSGSMTFTNNIVSKASTSGYGMYVYNPNFITSDYNNVYTPGGSLFYRGTPYYTTSSLEAWRSTAGEEGNSLSYNPGFRDADNGDLRPDPSSPNSWSVNGRGKHIANDTMDVTGAPRAKATADGVPDLGAYEFTPTSTPPACVANPAMPVANGIQSFTFGDDKVAEIAWGNDVPASAVTIRQYTGTKANPINNAVGRMFFFTSIDGTDLKYTARPKVFYKDPWIGDISSEANAVIARSSGGGAWEGYNYTNANTDIVANTLQATPLFDSLGNYTGVENGRIGIRCVAMPGGIKTSNITAFAVDIEWDPVWNPIGYQVIINTDPKTPTSATTGVIQTVTNQVSIPSGLQEDTKHYIHVRYICGAKDSSAWGLDSFVTKITCHDPDVKLSQLNSDKVVVSWGPVKTALHYEYIISKSSIAPSFGTQTQTTSVLAPYLTPGVSYYAHVRAKCSDIYEYSNWKTVPFQTWPLSVGNIANNTGIAVYPNPVTDVLQLEIAGVIGKGAVVELQDITGKVVMRSNVTTTKVELNVSELPSGMYLLKYHDEQRNELIKVNKQ